MASVMTALRATNPVLLVLAVAMCLAAPSAAQATPDACRPLPGQLQGGQLLVLDISSFTGYNYQPAEPAACCQACSNLDGCEGWSLCTSLAGCGSGCASAAGNASTADPIPLGRYGPYRRCTKDKFAYGTCSLRAGRTKTGPQGALKRVPAEGWVSGILPKPAKLDKRCPPGTSAKTCSTCLATADPTSCLKCQATANRLDSLAQCTTCANIKNRAARSACINCVAPKPGKPAAPCAACVVAYDAAKMIAPARVQAAVEACFGCHVKVAANVRAQCPRCFAGWFMVPSRSQQCVACLTKSKSLGRAAQCSVGLQLP